MSLEKIKKQFITSKTNKYYYYRVIINYCLGAASLITRVRLVSPTGGITGGSGNLSTSFSNVGGTSKICVGFQRQLRWDNYL
jgi:hypothetical protein